MKPLSTLIAATLLLSLVSAQAGSLWITPSTNERGMFADKRAKRVGDIVTIIVQENTTATNTLETKTNREAEVGKGNFLGNMVNQFIAAIPAILGKNKNFSDFQKENGLPKLNAPALVGGSTSYTGGGSITNALTASARTGVTVVDVLPNGNMVVEGVRLIRFSAETQYASLRGIIRPEDVTTDNTVLSSNIADAQVEFVSEGTLTEAQRKGWLARLAGKVTPY